MTTPPGRRHAADACGGGGWGRSAAASACVGPALREAAARLQAAGIPTARPDAEILLARALETRRLELHLQPARPIPDAARAAFDRLVTRRAGQEPLQYLVGEAEFCGLRIAVGPGVFIPRPETELLVERAVAACPDGPAVAVELCAGSGAVACALALARPALRVWAVERAPEAAAWARSNVLRLGLLGRVTVVEGDLFAPLGGRSFAGRCDLVLANPPYIPGPLLGSLPEEVRAWEPAEALDGGPDGRTVIGRIVDAAPAFLSRGGALCLELGDGQAPFVLDRLASDARYGPATAHRDLGGHDRVLVVRRR